MKSKQTTEKIQQIITDQKQLATRLASALLAAATISGGSMMLASCDKNTKTPEDPTTSANEVINSNPNEQQTNDIYFESATNEITEETTAPVEEINYEEELIKLLTNDYPEFNNGIYGIILLNSQAGDVEMYYGITVCTANENNEIIPLNIFPIELSKEEYNNIYSILENNFNTVYPTQSLTLFEDLNAEQQQKVCQFYYDAHLTNQENVLE